MPHVLTTNATVVCPHLGQGSGIPTDDRWHINGGRVLLEGDRGVIAGCVQILAPCLKYQLHSMGLNATSVGGRPVMLTTDLVLTNTGCPLVMLESHGVVDNSTPAPLPPGSSSTELPPELQEGDRPVVSASPNSLTYTSARADFLFTFTSRFPGGWKLTFAPLATSTLEIEDWTSGAIADVDVDPSGGIWRDATMHVTVTIKKRKLDSMFPGEKHYVTLTAFNQRGLAHHATVELTKS